jgi:hypothetical protein
LIAAAGSLSSGIQHDGMRAKVITGNRFASLLSS